MNRDSKSANSDYGSFCATPPVGEGGGASVPLAAGKPGLPYHALPQNGPELADNSIISGVRHILEILILKFVVKTIFFYFFTFIYY